MHEARFKYLVAQALGTPEFKELAEELVKQYSRKCPESELDTIREYERIRHIQELADMGENMVNELK